MLFQVAIEIQIIKKNETHSQDSAINSLSMISTVDFYFIQGWMYLCQYRSDEIINDLTTLWNLGVYCDWKLLCCEKTKT